MQNNRNSVNGGMVGGIVLVGIVLAFAFGGFNLFIFFTALAFASLVGSANRRNPQGMYGGIQGFVWLLALAFFFATGEWTWFLLAIVISAVLGSMTQPILRWLGTTTFFSMPQQTPPPQQYYQPPQQYYQPPQQAYQPPPSPPAYQEGYRPPAPAAETYEEAGQQYQYPSSSQYEQPQAQYPQEMPPPTQ
jgi:hypothetical protein